MTTRLVSFVNSCDIFECANGLNSALLFLVCESGSTDVMKIIVHKRERNVNFSKRKNENGKKSFSASSHLPRP